MAEPAQHTASEQKHGEDLQPTPPSQDQDTKPAAPSENGSASDQKEKEPQEGEALRAVDSNAEPEYPPMRKVVVIMTALYMSFFLVALVQNRAPLHSNQC